MKDSTLFRFDAEVEVCFRMPQLPQRSIVTVLAHNRHEAVGIVADQLEQRSDINEYLILSCEQISVNVDNSKPEMHNSAIIE